MSAQAALREASRRAARAAAEAALRRGTAVLAVARAEADAPEPAAPLALFAAAAVGERFFFEVPARGLALAAAGAAAGIEASGSLRFVDAEAAARALWAGVVVAGPPAPPEAGPVLVGGFAFEDEASRDARWSAFPPLRFTLPATSLARIGPRAWHTVATRVEPGEGAEAVLARLTDSAAPLARRTDERRPPGAAARCALAADAPHELYLRAVADAVAAVRRGDLEKVVLARACALERPGGFEAARVLQTLRSLHPACFLFGVGRGGAAFVGASPERLVRREGHRALAAALAGSAPRGRTPEEDDRLARALRESKKEQVEHAVVKRAVLAALAPAAEALEAPEAPRLLRLDGIHHLHTPVSARLPRREPESALALAARLHPTPAVGGAPRAPALAFLRAREATPRGWYAGGVGWLAPGGDGEFAVALRSALLVGESALLHAGAGVVADSSPDAELAETRLKLRAALGALLEI